MATAHLLTHNADWLSTFAEAWRRRARPIRLQWQKEGKYNEELFFRCSRQHFAQTEKSVLFDFHWSPKYCCRQITGTLFTLFFPYQEPTIIKHTHSSCGNNHRATRRKHQKIQAQNYYDYQRICPK